MILDKAGVPIKSSFEVCFALAWVSLVMMQRLIHCFCIAVCWGLPVAASPLMSI